MNANPAGGNPDPATALLNAMHDSRELSQALSNPDWRSFVDLDADSAVRPPGFSCPADPKNS